QHRHSLKSIKFQPQELADRLLEVQENSGPGTVHQRRRTGLFSGTESRPGRAARNGRHDGADRSSASMTNRLLIITTAIESSRPSSGKFSDSTLRIGLIDLNEVIEERS